MSKPVEWVDNDQRLAELCQQWQQQPVIALDTEFIRTRTFYPNIGLLQVADQQGIYLIDPLAISNTQALEAVWLNASVTKVVHSCSEDLEVFDRYLSVLPRPLFDTQIAAAFSGYGASISYANLVKAIRGDTIPKQETRSDWLQRPLSQSQLNYAALDVEHLIEVYTALVAQLEKSQRLDWVESECERALEKLIQNSCYDQYYFRVKSAWKLTQPQLAILRDLCTWREQQARNVNIPRNHLVKDAVLLDISRMQPKECHALYKIRDIPPRFVHQYGDECFAILEKAQQDSANYPNVLPAPLSAEQTALFKQLKEKVVARAEALNLPPECLARKNDLEALVYQAKNPTISLPTSLQGWRESIVGRMLVDYLLELK